MKNIVVALFMASILFACAGKKKEPPVVQQTASDTGHQQEEDSAAIRKVVGDFYNWYNKNYAQFQGYHLYEGIKKVDAPPYRINWTEVEKYQQFIRSHVPALGEEFISNQTFFLQQCDSVFKADKEDEIPYGFDYDWYTNSQEDPQYLADEINKPTAWPVKWKDGYATVEVKGKYDNNGKIEENTLIVLTLKKENGDWKFAKIGPEN
jgi:hypothetical protein